MITSQAELDEVYRSLEADLNALFKLVFTYRKPIAEADVRIASVILRKWLVGGLLGEFCHAAEVTPTFFVADNAEALLELSNQPTINFFLTGGVKFNGKSVFGSHHSSLPFQGKSLLPIDKMSEREVGLSEFLRQRRLFFEGEYFTCEDIVRYTANKLGAHLDFSRKGKFAVLEKASNFMKFGGPEPNAISMLNCDIYLTLEPKGAEAAFI
jgi:hypothetical protein